MTSAVNIRYGVEWWLVEKDVTASRKDGRFLSYQPVNFGFIAGLRFTHTAVDSGSERKDASLE